MQNTFLQNSSTFTTKIIRLVILPSILVLGFLILKPLFTSFQSALHYQERFDKIISEQQNDLDQFVTNLGSYSNPFGISHDLRFRKRVFLKERIIYWSDDLQFPNFDLSKEDGGHQYSGEDGKGVILKESIGETSEVIILSYYPVLINYSFDTQSSTSELNQTLFDSQITLDTNGLSKEVIYYKGSSIVNIIIKNKITSNQLYVIFILLLILAVAVFLLTLRHTSRYKYLFFTCIILFVRVFLEWVMGEFGSLEIFEPVNFTSILGRSAGVLLLNVLTVAGLYYGLKGSIVKLFSDLNNSIYLVVIPLAIISSALVFAYLLNDLIDHSQIALDITSSIQFEPVKIVFFIILVVMILLLTHFTKTLVSNRTGELLPKIIIILIVLWSIVYLYSKQYSYFISPLVIGSILVLLFNYNGIPSKLEFKLFTSIIIVSLSFSLTTALVLNRQAEKEDLIKKQKFANTLLIQNDFTAELFLNSVLSRIAKDGYIKSRFLSERLSTDLIEGKIRNEYLSPYFNKYALDIHLLRADDEKRGELVYPLGDSVKKFMTAFENLYLIRNEQLDYSDKYMAEIPFKSLGGDLGKLVIFLSLKKYIPRSIYPQIISNQELAENVSYDYAVFKKQTLLYRRGKHPFEAIIDFEIFEDQQLFDNGLELEGVHYYGVKTHDGRVIVISSNLGLRQKIIQNLSFYFSVYLLCWLLLLIAYSITKKLNLSLSSKIQITLSASIFVPMIVVAGALLTTLSSSYKSEIDRNFTKRSFNIAENLIDLTEQFLLGNLNHAEFTNEIIEKAEITQSDLNIYDIAGRLIVSSQPQIFGKSILSELIDPKAINALKYGNEDGIILDRNIGSVGFKSSFTAIRSYRDGKLLAFLSMPYFDSKNHLRKQQIEVFNNLTMIFSVIFLIAYFAQNLFIVRLIEPLKRIAEKLSRTQLEESNEPLDYDSDDEIGQLVLEYNSMLSKLEDSKQALAESQKESAWKEIAKQVAHEIKNPLTPMRLRIQQLIRSSNDAPDQKSVLSSLIDQIDSLSAIADSFSAFAAMPAPNNERFDILDTIRSVSEVYQTDDINLELNVPQKVVLVNADPKLISRVFTNVILNALQSIKLVKPSIVIAVKLNERNVLISVQDNGQGMSEEVRLKVFKPYFSTKSTGSGIGLAVAKKGIENAGGNIWFESVEGEGTTFFIKLPLA